MLTDCTHEIALAIARAEVPVFAAIGGHVRRVDCSKRRGEHARYWLTTRGGARIQLRVRYAPARTPLMYEDGSGWVKAGGVTVLVSPAKKWPLPNVVD